MDFVGRRKGAGRAGRGLFGGGNPLALDLILAAVLAGAFFSYYQFSSSHLCGTDPYYHIKFAELTRQKGLVHEFPWAQWSSWKDSFFDKEVLYHLYLSLFTFGDLMTGAKVANVILGIAIFTLFMAFLRAHRVAWPWLWWFLLISSGGYFLFRMNVTRPQVFSVLILLGALHFLIGERHYMVGLFSLVYSLSYTGHYQYVGLALGYVGIVYLTQKRLPWRIFVYALVGMGVGWVVHPNFPHNVSGFFIQNVMVIANQWAPTVNLNMGGELNPMTTRSMLGVCGATLIPLWIAYATAMLKRPPVNTKTIFLFAASTVYLILTLFTKRFAEYWIPVTGLFVAFFFSPIFRRWDPISGIYDFFAERRLLGGQVGGVIMLVALFVGLGGLFISSHFDSYRQVKNCGDTTYGPSARFVRDKIPKGSKILTCDWDDAPYVFYYSTAHYYTVFLDPNFMYLWRPKVWHTWDALTHARDKTPVDTIRSYFKSRYVYCTGDFGAFRSQLRRSAGAVEIYPPPRTRERLRNCQGCERRRGFERCRVDKRCIGCNSHEDCPTGAICKHPGPPAKEEKGRAKRCEPDPHVFIFRVD